MKTWGYETVYGSSVTDIRNGLTLSALLRWATGGVTADQLAIRPITSIDRPLLLVFADRGVWRRGARHARETPLGPTALLHVVS